MNGKLAAIGYLLIAFVLIAGAVEFALWFFPGEEMQLSDNPVIANLQQTEDGRAQLKFLGIDPMTGKLASHSLAPLKGDD